MADTGNLFRVAISKGLADKLGLTPKDLEPIPGYATLGTAADDGEGLKVLGKVKRRLRLNLGGGTRDIAVRPVVLANLSMAMNLSGPFLKMHKIDVLSNGSAVVQGVEIPLTSGSGDLNSLRAAYSLIYTTEDMVVQPDEMALLPCVAKSVADKSMAADYLHVAGDGSYTEKYNLNPVTNSILSCEKDGSIRVPTINSTHHPIKVYKGSLYGVGHEVTYVAAPRREPWKVCLMKPLVETPTERVRGCAKEAQEIAPPPPRRSEMHPNKQKQTSTQRASEDTKTEEENEQKKEDINKLVEAYMDGTKPLPEQLKGPTTPRNRRYRINWLIRFFKLDSNEHLRDRKHLQATIALFLKYWRIWAFDGNFGKTHLLEHRIEVQPGTEPVHQRYRPCNPLLEKDMAKQLDIWLKHKVIEESNSPWNFSLVAAVKKNNRIRWCVDWRDLNKVTIKDRYPIGDCETNLTRLADSAIYSTVDAIGAFHSVPIRPSDREKTSFSTPFGTFQFRMMGFGLCNVSKNIKERETHIKERGERREDGGKIKIFGGREATGNSKNFS